MLCNDHKGMTLIEVVVVVVIVVALALVSIRAFSRFGAHESVAISSQTLASALEDARARTLSSEEAMQYGVHLENGAAEATLFVGDTYAVGAEGNVDFAFDPRVRIAAISSGSPTDVVFERLTGVPSVVTTVTMAHRSDESISQNVIVSGTGLISVE